jgi:hypothetical protein
VYKERYNGQNDPLSFPVTLSCNTKDDSDSVVWYTSGTLTDLNKFTNADKSLALPGITEDQSASVAGTDYWCCATNTVGTVCSKNHTLFYASFLIHKWIRAPDTISAFHGYDAVIPCRVPSDAQPPATVEWTVDGTVIDSNDDSDKYTYVPSGDLEIDNVRRDMNGSVYVCRVTNFRVTFSLHSGRSTTLLVRENSKISLAPQFVKQPVDTVAVVDEEVVLECAADSAKLYLWYKDDDQAKQTQLLGTGNFQLVKVKTTDAGSYMCQAVNAPRFNDTQLATLTVHVPPVIKKSTSEHIAYTGAPFELDCEASGKPTPEMKWLDDGVVQSYSRKFSIAKVVKADEGLYQCFAISSAGVDQHVVKVTVKDPKINSVAISPQLLSIVVGSVKKFRCHSSGDPTPDLEWLFDGDLIIPDYIDINITQKTTSEFLQLSKLTYRVKEKSLGGVHKVTCRAKNHAGSNDSTSSLTVEVGGEIRKQEIQNTFNIVRDKAKSNSLPCPSYGYPPVHQVWLKGKVAVDVKQSRINLSATGSLVIGHVDVADEGEYTCNIKNTVGKKTFTDSVKMNLTVTVETKVTEVGGKPPTLEKNKATLTCRADVRPKGTLTWETNGTAIDVCDNCPNYKITTKWDESSVLSTLEFTVDTSSSFAYGDYMCIIDSEAGRQEEKFTLKNTADKNVNTTSAPLVERTALKTFPLIGVLVPVLIIVILIAVVLIVAFVQRGKGTYEPAKHIDDNVGTFHLRTQGGGGELYAAPPDVIQHRSRFMAQQKADEADGGHTYAQVGKKNLPHSGDDEERLFPPYPVGKPAPPYPGKVRPRGPSSSSELPPYPGTPATNNPVRVMSGSSFGDSESNDTVAKPPLDSPSLQVPNFLLPSYSVAI